jgi:hypothetical protein
LKICQANKKVGQGAIKIGCITNTVSKDSLKIGQSVSQDAIKIVQEARR